MLGSYLSLFGLLALLMSNGACIAQETGKTEHVKSSSGRAIDDTPRTESEKKKAGREGYFFYRNKNFPKLGEAWMDPSGRTWGDAVRNEKGEPKRMTQDEAIEYCKSIDARLPSKRDFETLHYYSRGFSILPEQGDAYWTSTIVRRPILGLGSPLGFVAFAGGETINSYSSDSRMSVRCVMP